MATYYTSQLRDEQITRSIDWITVSIYALLVLFGWLNIHASVYDPEVHKGLLDFSTSSGKQFIWICTSIILLSVILIIDHRFYDTTAWGIYGAVFLLLFSVLLFGKEVKGSKSWFEIGGLAIQPAEFAKMGVALALSKFMSSPNIKMDKLKNQLIGGGIILLPALMVLLQNDTGSFLVFSSFLIVFYREGMSPFIIIVGVACAIILVLTLVFQQYHLMIAFGILGICSIYFVKRKTISNILVVLGVTAATIVYIGTVDYFFNNVLQPHQQTRLKVLVNPDVDPLGAGWQVTQAKIAIGSGGFLGKGYLQGTQTKFDFVPDQSTDNIFCTVGEEHGWLGSFVLISLFMALFLRLIYLAERQKVKFARIFGYCVASVMFFHFTINIGMTIGLFPVIGIPLPFFSYGGSSLWAFTIMLFMFLNFDASRRYILG
ncbi:MAG: rod shape-determining protein RodA [Opitutaceae bacterium]|nr:rod shape-determining protein RodA [Cytophagales bacterium]